MHGVDWNSLISAVIGGLITGVFTLWAVDKTHKNDLIKDDQQEKLLIRGFIQSIKTEIETLWDVYQEGVGKNLEVLASGEPFLRHYPLTQQEYFTIYEGNSNLVGRVKNEELRKLIVETYTKARGLIDSYRLNNEMLHKLDEIDSTIVQSGSLNLSNRRTIQIKGLIDYAPKILKEHNQTKESKNNLIRIIREERY